jgi:hypothetical protein
MTPDGGADANIEEGFVLPIGPNLEKNRRDLNDDLEALDIVSASGIEMHVVRLKNRVNDISSSSKS